MNFKRITLGLLLLAPAAIFAQEAKPLAYHLDVRGPLDRAKAESLRRRLNAALRASADLIIFHLDSPQGEIAPAREITEEVRQLRERQVKTYAIVPANVALGSATFVALSCDKIYLGENAGLADFAYLSADERKALAPALLDLVRQREIPDGLFEAALDHTTGVYEAVDGGRTRYYTKRQTQEKNVGGMVHDNPKKVPADWAKAEGWALKGDVASLDPIYESHQVRFSRDDWLDQLAEFFRQPWVNFLLVAFGVLGLFLELKLAGTAVPGVLGVFCFVLFFWSYSFVGQFPVLAAFLFVLGLALIVIEVLVIPGFAFTGIAGLILVLGSLVLVTLEKMPTTTGDWAELGARLAMLTGSLIAAGVASAVVIHFLPHIPLANRLVLEPPADPEITRPRYAHLLGAIGVTLTTCRPGGKAQFGSDFLDVIAEGEFIREGREIRVIEVEGYRIVIKEL